MIRLFLPVLLFTTACLTPQDGVFRFRDGLGGQCSAFMIESNVAVTAKHCVYNASDIMYIVDNMGMVHYVDAIVVLEGDGFNEDFAILSLDKPIKNTEVFYLSDSIESEDLKIIAFESGEYPYSGDIAIVRNTVGVLIVRSDKIVEGMSGSPVFYEKDGKRYAVGVISFMYPSIPGHGGASKIDNIKIGASKIDLR